MKGTIKSADELSLLFKTAHKHTTTNLMVLEGERTAPSNKMPKQGSLTAYPQNQTPHPQQEKHRGRLAFIAGKRLGNAPKRNKAKRLMREAARQLKAPWNGRDVVFVAREQTATAPLSEIVRDMERLLKRMNGRNDRQR
jgi:ribonuclease P protein component